MACNLKGDWAATLSEERGTIGMAGIAFSDTPETVWIVAGWAYRQFLQDLRIHSGCNPPVLDVLVGATNVGFLDLSLLREPLRREVASAIETVCRCILDGSCLPSFDAQMADRDTEREYKKAMAMLLCALDASRDRRA